MVEEAREQQPVDDQRSHADRAAQRSNRRRKLAACGEPERERRDDGERSGLGHDVHPPLGFRDADPVAHQSRPEYHTDRSERMPHMKHLALVLLIALSALGCTGSNSAVPVLSTVDAIGKGVSKLLGWCEEHDVSIEDVLKAKKALDEGRYAEAATLAAKLVEAVGEHEDVPDEIALLAGLVKAAAAAQAIDEGMSAISQPSEKSTDVAQP